MVRWEEIEAECGDFRAGFVATFRKYEGQATDERDGQNRIVKVTAASFARHMGIPERTFKGWLVKEQNGGQGRAGQPDRDQHGARKVLQERPAEVAAEIAKAMEDPEVAEAVAKAATPKARDTVQRAVHEEVLDDLTQKANAKARAKGQVTMGGAGATGMSQQLIDSTMDLVIDRMLVASSSAVGRMNRKGFNLIRGQRDTAEIVEATRAKLTEIGQNVAALMDGLDTYEANALANEGQVTS